MSDRERARALAWSKEVERRARDEYKKVFPDTQRTKFAGREDYAGCTDLVGLPIHVQVKARAGTWVDTQYRAAAAVAGSKTPSFGVHLVTQAKRGPMLVTMKLSDYIDDMLSIPRPRV